MSDLIEKITVISALGSAIFAAVSAWQAKKSAKQTNEIAKRNEHNELDKRLDEILKIAIQYPYLESKAFTKEWNHKKGSDDIRYIRYDNFCNLVFNYIHKVYLTFDKDKTKVENARNKITSAVIGLVLLVSSFVLLSFLSKLLFAGEFDLLKLTVPGIN